MKFLLLSLFLSAMLLCASDVTGRWSGSVKAKNRDGEYKTSAAFLVFKQDGGRLTGTVGPTADRQNGTLTGRVDNNHVTFDVENQGGVLNFKLELDGETITGEIRRARTWRDWRM